MKKIAIFASGSGSNAVKIIEHLRATNSGITAYIICNKPKAGIHTKAQDLGIPIISIDNTFKKDPTALIQKLLSDNIDLLVLAGFLWKIPEQVVSAFPKKIVNIHPALLPQYGGKGMYGKHIHEAVIANKESQSGLTIHYVNEKYDDGEYIMQVYCPVLPTDTAEELGKRVLRLEHTYFPIAIASILQQ